MNEVVRPTTPTPALAQRRQTKFTPANIRQIINLVERGKSKAEIAEIIGVTPATLQVTCSKLGISLRRPTMDASGVPRQRRPRGTIHNLRELNREAGQTIGRDEKIQTEPEAANLDEDHTIIRLHAKQQLTEGASSNSVTLTIRHNGEKRTIDLPLDRHVLGLFALEAEFRSMGTGDLVGQIFLSIAKNNLFKSVLEHSHSHSKDSKDHKRSGQPPTSDNHRSEEDSVRQPQ